MKFLSCFCSVILTVFLIGCGAPENENGTKFLEEVKKTGDELLIPYQKHELKNGLTLIIHEDHSDPIVHVDVTYNVGSSREHIGISGFAHFYEHMMFQGSEHVGDEQHFKLITQAGGTLNGTTNLDRTNYYETLPSNQLELALWLESDRMGYFLDSVTQKKFEIQRATVKNERGQNYDNRPYGLIREKLAQAIFPYGHPYSWPTIGYIDDLNQASLDDLKRFFMRWYGPNNATLTVAGDIQADSVIALAEKYFGNIPRCPEVKPIEKTPVTLAEDRFISYPDNIRTPKLVVAIPTVHTGHPDEAPLDILSDILGGNNNSIFYKNFVKEKMAYDARVGHPCQQLAGFLQIEILPAKNKTLVEMEQLVRESIDEFEDRGVNDDDLIRFKASHEARVINGLSSVAGKASKLASFQTFWGNPNRIQEDLQRYLDVTAEDIVRVYNQYVKDKPRVVLSVYPKNNPEMVVAPDNFTYKYDVENAPKNTEYDGLTYVKPPPDDFDRSVAPVPTKGVSINLPDYWQESFPNGLRAIGIKNDEIPTVALQLYIEAGHISETKEQAGIARLVANMMNESTINYSSAEIKKELAKIGSTVHVTSDDTYIQVGISCLKKNLDKTLELTKDVLLMPKFDPIEFDRVKAQQVERLADQVTRARTIADNVFDKVLYGEDHIMATSNHGTLVSLNLLTLEDVETYYRKRVSPSVSGLVVVGDVEKDEILSKLGFLKEWKPVPKEVTGQPPFPNADPRKLYLVHKAGAPQSEIRIGYVALPYDATEEFYRANIMNYPLGGGFTSRVNLNLREDKGWTYGARTRFRAPYSSDKGIFVAQAGVRTDATAGAVAEFIKEMTMYVDSGITEDELDFTKKSMGQMDARRFETPLQKTGFLGRILAHNLEGSFVDEQNKILQEITKEEVDNLARKHLDLGLMSIVVVGDRKKIYEDLSKLNYEIVDLDPDGNRILWRDDNIEFIGKLSDTSEEEE